MTTLESISILNKIFKRKEWYDRDVNESVFDNFCLLLDNIKEHERDLILELIDRYEWISFNQYQEKILEVLESVEEEKLKGLKKIYIFPVIKREDEGGIKSGPFLMYQIKACKNLLKKYSSVEFVLISKFKSLSESELKLKESECIFLLDDYVGSGETLNFCLDEIEQNSSITNEKLNIITIAFQRETYDSLITQGISVYTNFISPRGLSDFNVSPILDEKINLMLDIEKLIPGGSNFSLGYNNSEALITLARTPDNTFPIFWMRHRIGKKYFDAPFSRNETLEL